MLTVQIILLTLCKTYLDSSGIVIKVTTTWELDGGTTITDLTLVAAYYHCMATRKRGYQLSLDIVDVKGVL